MYRRGIVKELDVAKHRARVEFPDKQGVVSGWLDVLVGSTHDDKEYSLPSVGNQVAVMMDEKDEDGCVLGAIYSGVDAPTASSEKIRRWNFADGGICEYNRDTHVLKVDVPSGGTIEIGGNDSAIALATKVKTELDNLKAEFAALATVYNGHLHTGNSTVCVAPGNPWTGAVDPTLATYTPGYNPSDVGSEKAKSS